MLYFARIEVFPCCNFFVLQSFHVALFCVAIFSCSTFFILHYFHVALFKLHFLCFAFFSCCTLSILHFSPDELCSCCIISMLHFFRAPSRIFFLFSFIILKSIENERNKENRTIKTTLHSELSLFHFYFDFLMQVIAFILFWSGRMGTDHWVGRKAIALPNTLQ